MKNNSTPRLFNAPALLCSILAVPLAGFFIAAIFFHRPLFSYLTVGLVIAVLYMITLRNRIQCIRSDANLKVLNYDEQSNLVQAEIDQEKIAIQSFRDKIVNFGQLKGLTEKLSMCLTLEDTSKTLSAEVNRLFGHKDTTIILYLFHSKTGELGISSSQKGQMRINIKSKRGDVFDQWLVKTMQPLLIEDAKSDYRFDSERVATPDAREVASLISVPLMVGNKALGILRIDSPQENLFMTEDLRFLTTIGDLGAIAIENAQLYEHIEQLAIKDSLTNLYLRRYLLERIPEEIARHMRHKNNMAFLMIDLDHFKQYNDRFGHVAGDIVLKAVGKILAETFNEPGMLVCRYGGEEFSALIPDCSQQKAAKLAESVRKQVAEKTIVLRREKTKITISVGIAMFSKNAENTVELIHQADLALYEAKKKGRNRVQGA